MGNDDAFRVVPGSSPQDGETMGQITEDFLRLIFDGPIPKNALRHGALTRPLDVLVVPKNKKQLHIFPSTIKSLLSWHGINIYFKLPIGMKSFYFDICCILVRSALVLT